MCCTDIQLRITNEPIDFVCWMQNTTNMFPNTFGKFILAISLGVIDGYEMQLGSLEIDQFLLKWDTYQRQ